ncbi:hypothetical protein JG688_00007486 [Phytophthora aleatoria]|uniref:Uncharacterized protein n=1 Tax=Phytophthora aleatoria TaxID=2496075 RepID=A0A8J5M5N1_9STRA|nr:hypothetical protein JG688_00007486 [Phytophthora aleatoria]
MAATPDCEVCVYMDNIRPSCGFMSFRAGLSRVGVDALKAACEHRSGPTSVLGLQLRDQFINLLWESCLDSRKTEVPVVATAVETRRAKVVYSATGRRQVERANPKKQKTDIPPIDVNLTVEDIQVIQLPQDEEKTASKATVTELFEEVKRLQAENRKFSEANSNSLRVNSSSCTSRLNLSRLCSDFSLSRTLVVVFCALCTTDNDPPSSRHFSPSRLEAVHAE